MSDDQTPPAGRNISSHYRLAVPRWVLLAMLSKMPKPYSLEAAAVSYLLDLDAGTVKSIRDYARLWEWSKKKVEHNLPTVREMGAEWGQFSPETRGTAGGQQGDSRGTKGREKLTESPEQGTAGGHEGDSRGTLTNVSHSQEEKDSECETREREDLSGMEGGVWTAETMPIRAAYVEQTGKGPPPNHLAAIRRLMRPTGDPGGMTHDDAPGQRFSGYTGTEIAEAVGRMFARNWNSPAALVAQLAGLWNEPKRKQPTTNGTHRQVPDQRHSGFREPGKDLLRAVKESIAKRNGIERSDSDRPSPDADLASRIPVDPDRRRAADGR